jgi:hypothetical protein
VLDRVCVAVVGARRCTAQGREIAQTIARGLVDAGLGVVSGLPSWAVGWIGFNRRLMPHWAVVCSIRALRLSASIRLVCAPRSIISLSAID